MASRSEEEKRVMEFEKELSMDLRPYLDSRGQLRPRNEAVNLVLENKVNTLDMVDIFVEKIQSHPTIIPQQIPLRLVWDSYHWNDSSTQRQMFKRFMGFFKNQPNVECLCIPAVSKFLVPAIPDAANSLIRAAIPCGLKSLNLKLFQNINSDWVQSALGMCPQLEKIGLRRGNLSSTTSACIHTVVEAMKRQVHLKEFSVGQIGLESDNRGLEILVDHFIRLDKLEVARLHCNEGLTRSSLPHLTRLFREIPASCQRMSIEVSEGKSLFSNVGSSNEEELEEFFVALEQKGCQRLFNFILEDVGLSPAHMVRLFQIFEKMDGKLQPCVFVKADRIFDEQGEAFKQLVLSLPNMKQDFDITERENFNQNWSTEQNDQLLQGLHQNTKMMSFVLQLGTTPADEEDAEGDEFLWQEKSVEQIMKRNKALRLAHKFVQPQSELDGVEQGAKVGVGTRSAPPPKVIPTGMWAPALAQVSQTAGHFGADPCFVVFRHMVRSSAVGIIETIHVAKKRPAAQQGTIANGS